MCTQHTVILSSLCTWKCQKMVVFCCNRYAVREAKEVAVRSTHGQNRAERSTQGRCHPHGNGLWYLLYQVYDSRSNML